MTVNQVKQEYAEATCLLRTKQIRPCSVLDETSVEVPRCKVTVLFSPTYKLSTGQIVTSSSNNSVAVRNPGDHRGCVFQNCAEARGWYERRFPEGTKNVGCWALRSTGTPVLEIDYPGGSSRRDSIIFTVCASIAGILVLAMMVVMVQLIVRDCKETL